MGVFTASSKTGFKDETDWSDPALRNLVIGFGLFLAWMLIAHSLPWSLSGIAGTSPSVSTDRGVLLETTMTATIALSLILLAITNQLLLRFYMDKLTLILSCVIGTAGGGAIMAALWMTGTTSLALQISCTVALGMSISLFIVLWGTAFSRLSLRTIVIGTVLAASLAAFIFLALLHWLTGILAILCVLALPIVSTVLLAKITPVPYFNRSDVIMFHPLRVRRGFFAFRVGLPCLCFGMVYGHLRHYCLQAVLASPSLEAQLSSLGAIAICVVVLPVRKLFSRNDLSHPWILKASAVLLAFGVGATAFTQAAPLFLTSFFAVTGMIASLFLAWSYFARVSEHFKISPIFVFGLCVSFIEGGALLESLAIGSSLLPLAYQSESLQVVALLVIAVFAFFAIPRKAEIQELFVQGSILEPAASAEEALADAVVTGKEIAVRGAVVAQDLPTEPVLMAVESVNPEETTSDIKPHENREEDESEESATVKRRFRDRCDQVASEYNLSRREAEVLVLLARGHNASYIHEKLFISHSTVKTHIYHIYRKLDIHTQQELLRMVSREYQEEGSKASGAFDGFDSEPELAGARRA